MPPTLGGPADTPTRPREMWSYGCHDDHNSKSSVAGRIVALCQPRLTAASLVN